MGGDISTDNSPVQRPGRSIESLSADERHFLTMVRQFMDGIARPNDLGWITALIHAEQHLADRQGARLAYGVLAAVQALRGARPVDFRYHRASCLTCSQVLTPDEQLFVAAFRGAQKGDDRGLSHHLCLLTFGPDHRQLACTLRQLALDFHFSGQVATRTPL